MNFIELADEIGKQPNDVVSLIFYEALEKGKIDFIALTNAYIDHLKKINKEQRDSIANLGLFLGLYCMTDKSDSGKTARKYLFESGMYTGNDGSGLGKMLSEEFS